MLESPHRMEGSIYYPDDEYVTAGEAEGGCVQLADLELGLMGEESEVDGGAENPFLYPGEEPERSGVEQVRLRVAKAGRQLRARMPSKWTFCCCCGISTVVCATCSLLLLALVIFVVVELAIFFFHHKDLAFLLF